MERSSTIAELMERRRIQAGAKEYQGHTYMDLARFDEATKHMIIFDVLTNESPVGWKGERNRLYLSEAGIRKLWTTRKPVTSRLSVMPMLPEEICITTAEIWHDDIHSTACRR